MALFEKITRTTLEIGSGGIKKLITFDAVTKRTETNTAKVSKHPVEQGFVITDNVVIDNLRLSVEGVISSANNSILDEAVDRLPASVSSLIPSSVSSFLGIGISDPDQARLDMRAAFNARTSVILVTSEQTYPITIDDGEFRLVITALAFDKRAPTKGLLSFKMKLEQIRIVKSETGGLAKEAVAVDADKITAGEVTGNTKTLIPKKKSQLLQIMERKAKKANASATATAAIAGA